LIIKDYITVTLLISIYLQDILEEIGRNCLFNDSAATS